MNKNTLSDNLEHLAKIHGLSINELSKKSGVSQPTLHRMVMGTTTSPRRAALESLAAFFNISISQLTGIEPLPLTLPKSMSKKFHLHEIPIISWDLVKNWPFDAKTVEYSFNHVVMDKDIAPLSFALIFDNPKFSPLFDEGTLLIFSPTPQPKDRNFVLVYFSDNDSIEFNRLFIDGKDYYLKKEDTNKNIQLIKLNLKKDKIVAVLIEARTSFN